MRWVFLLLLAACHSDEKDPGTTKEAPKEESKGPGSAEVRAFAKNAGIDPRILKCSAIGETQAFVCRTNLPESDAAKLADAWGLVSDDPKNAALMRGKKYGCEGFADFKDVTYKAWASKEKPEKLAGMNYARIYHRADTDKVCIEMEKLGAP